MRRPRSRQEVALELPAQDESFSDTATQEQRYDEPTQQARRSALATLRRLVPKKAQRPPEPIVRFRKKGPEIRPNGEPVQVKEVPPTCMRESRI